MTSLTLVSAAIVVASLAHSSFASEDPHFLQPADGAEEDSSFGAAIVGIGDVNGDGFGDILVGAPVHDVGSFQYAGRAHLYSGATGALIHTFNSLAPSQNSRFGQSVAAPGDVDLDGVDDIAIGAPGEDRSNGSADGRVYIYSGKTRALLYLIEPNSAADNDSFGWRMTGLRRQIPGIEAGLAIAAQNVPSVDRAIQMWALGAAAPNLVLTWASASLDGAGDALGTIPASSSSAPEYLLVGAPLADFGATTDAGSIMLADPTLSGALESTFETSPNMSADGHFGHSVAGLRDVTGDGQPELLVAAPYEPSSIGLGRVYLYSLDFTLIREHHFDLDPLVASSLYGLHVASVPDLDGDGFDDYVVGEVREYENGVVHVYSGWTGFQIALLSAPASAAGYDDVRYGFLVAGVPDVSGDERGDVIVADVDAIVDGEPYAGAVFVHYECPEATDPSMFGEMLIRAACDIVPCGEEISQASVLPMHIQFASEQGSMALIGPASFTAPGSSRWWKGFNPQPDPPGVTAAVDSILVRGDAEAFQVNANAFFGGEFDLDLAVGLIADETLGGVSTLSADAEFGLFTRTKLSTSTPGGLEYERLGTVHMRKGSTRVIANSPCDGAAPMRFVIENGEMSSFSPDAWDHIMDEFGGDLDPTGTPTVLYLAGELADTPLNDACADALLVGDGLHAFTLEGATTDGDAIICTGGPGQGDPAQVHNDVWFDYVPRCSGTATVRTCLYTDVNTKIAVYAGASCDVSDLIGCNNNACGSQQSEITFPVNAWEHYRVRLGGSTQSQQGFGYIQMVSGISCPAPCPDANAWFTTSAFEFAAESGPYTTFLTTEENVALSLELGGAIPIDNAQLGGVLTFPAGAAGIANTVQVRCLESEAGFTFNDHEGVAIPVGFSNALSVGDIDNFELDAWDLEFLDGPPVYSFGVVIGNCTGEPMESLNVICEGGEGLYLGTIGTFAPIPSGDEVFIGVISDTPIARIFFNESPTGDDISISDFRIGNQSACGADLNGNGFVEAADFGLLLAEWGPCAGNDVACLKADVNNDGMVDAADIGLLLAAWGGCL